MACIKLNRELVAQIVKGRGFSFPSTNTTDRLALGLGSGDAGMQVYDTTLQRNFIWTGSAWFAGAGNGPQIYAGNGSPGGVIDAPPGSIYFDISNPAGPVQYVKASGTGNTGWL
jgi:hypothetical protein